MKPQKCRAKNAQFTKSGERGGGCVVRETYCCEGLVVEGCMLIRDGLRGWCYHMGIHLRLKTALKPRNGIIIVLVPLVIIVLQEEYCPYREEGGHPKCLCNGLRDNWAVIGGGPTISRFRPLHSLDCGRLCGPWVWPNAHTWYSMTFTAKIVGHGHPSIPRMPVPALGLDGIT